jgi:hypothetical protein
MHTDPELLSLLALGEHAGTEDDRTHAQTCPECAHELSQLLRLVTLGRAVEADTQLVSPSDRVWARISQDLALGSSEPSTPSPIRPPSDDPRPLAASDSAAKRARRGLLTVIKAAIAGSAHEFEEELTAQARLTPVEPSWSRASGEAEIATDEHGRRLLQVTLHADLPSTGLRQAWLVHRDDPLRRQSLGILDGPHGLWTVEHSIDLEKYAILEISQQGAGETDHSGHTIVRGEFALAG